MINEKDLKMPAQMTKSQLIEKIAAEKEVAKKDVKGVLETLATIGYKELKKTGVFLVPGFAKFVVIKKPATKARQGTNPFTGEPMTFKAKPARKIVRARPGQGSKRRGMNVERPPRPGSFALRRVPRAISRILNK
jgi:DNA-binding protein HU-beta